MIYICIPALNEAPTVGVLVWKIRQVMAEFGREYHVLLLDDGSTDDTQEVLAPYAQVMPLTVLRNERTQGYAAAVERLLRETVARSTHPRRDAAVVLQADFTESPADVPALIRRLEGGADVVGGRAGPARDAPRLHRWLGAAVSWLLARRPTLREIEDATSGFRAYRVAVLKRTLQDSSAPPVLTGGGWAANVQLLAAVAPHARRAESTEVAPRSLPRARASRQRPWGMALDVWRVSRGTVPAAPPAEPAAAPALAPAPAAASTAKPPRRRGGRRRPPRTTQQGDTP